MKRKELRWKKMIHNIMRKIKHYKTKKLSIDAFKLLHAFYFFSSDVSLVSLESNAHCSQTNSCSEEAFLTINVFYSITFGNDNGKKIEISYLNI